MARDPIAQDPTLGHGPIGPETDIATICVHGGYPHEGDGTTARAAPLHRTTSYQFKSVEHAADLFALSELGNIYTRLGNPTTDILEKRLALMHGGPELGALAMASGTVAIFQAITNVAEAGDNIVSANNLYGGTMTMFEHILPKMGITCTFVDPKDPPSFLPARPPPPHTHRHHHHPLPPLTLPSPESAAAAAAAGGRREHASILLRDLRQPLSRYFGSRNHRRPGPRQRPAPHRRRYLHDRIPAAAV